MFSARPNLPNKHWEIYCDIKFVPYRKISVEFQTQYVLKILSDFLGFDKYFMIFLKQFGDL
jgi:hypothetical protein